MIADLTRYAEYKESGLPWLGQVPAHWDVRRLKSRLLRNDAGVWGTTFDERGTTVLRSTEQSVDGGWRIVNPARLILTDNQRKAAVLNVGDLVVTKSSGSALHIGKTSLVTQRIADLACCFSNFMQRLRVSSNVSPAFAWRLLNSRIGREQFVYQSTTTTGLGNLNGSILGNCTFAFPPPVEQAAIVRFLDWADGRLGRAIGAKRKVIALLDEQRQAIVRRAVTRGLDPDACLKESGVEFLGEVPEHWDIQRLSHVCRFQPGKAHEQFIDSQGDFVCVNSRFVSTGGKTRKFCTKNLSPAKQHDVLMVMSDLPNGRALARAYFVDDEGAYAVNQRVCILSAHKVHPKLMFYQLNRNPRFLQHDDGLNQTHLSNAVFKTFPTLIPPPHEQTAIVEYLDRSTVNIDIATSRLDREIELLSEYRTRLVADVVTGKLDVREAAARLPQQPALDSTEYAESRDETEADEEAAA